MFFYAGLVVDYLKNYMKTRLTYRSDFWIEVLSDLLFNGLNLFFILVVFGHTASIDEWNEQQVLFIYGYFMVAYGIFITFFNLWSFSEKYIVKGEMDRILTRPAHNLVQLMLENMDPSSLFSALVGFLIMVFTWPQLGLTLTWSDPFIFLLLLVGSIMIYAGVYIFFTALSFFSDAPTGITALLWNLQNYGRYPMTIYNAVMKFALTWVLPFGFVGFYPSAYFLDRTNWGSFALLTPVVGLVFFGIGLATWNYGVKRYRGAGS
ncbi:ABC-2 family transporter protein [Paenibacillus filicis]|uniref:ABC-2 family transporter protein n=1 Tax=Paenibacillus filicis TaxID=669464 RepID=A0ABU9DVZ1_9BACL